MKKQKSSSQQNHGDKTFSSSTATTEIAILGSKTKMNDGDPTNDASHKEAEEARIAREDARASASRAGLVMSIDGLPNLRLADPGNDQIEFRRNSQGQFNDLGMWALDDVENHHGFFAGSSASNVPPNAFNSRDPTREYQEWQDYQANDPYLARTRPDAAAPRPPIAAPAFEVAPSGPGGYLATRSPAGPAAGGRVIDDASRRDRHLPPDRVFNAQRHDRRLPAASGYRGSRGWSTHAGERRDDLPGLRDRRDDRPGLRNRRDDRPGPRDRRDDRPGPHDRPTRLSPRQAAGRHASKLAYRAEAAKRASPMPGKGPEPPAPADVPELLAPPLVHPSEAPYLEENCGACHQRGHDVAKCAFPTLVGDIVGCPICNYGSHIYDECPRKQGTAFEKFIFLCWKRSGLPPLRCRMTNHFAVADSYLGKLKAEGHVIPDVVLWPVTRAHARRERESDGFKAAWAKWNSNTSRARAPFWFLADPALPTFASVAEQVAAGTLDNEVYLEKQYRPPPPRAQRE